jgi:hypothetical protein
MWTDLLTSEMSARSAQHKVTERASIYIATGLPLDQVLDALKISRATWYRRLDALTAWKDDNRAAARRINAPPEPTTVDDVAAELRSVSGRDWQPKHECWFATEYDDCPTCGVNYQDA